MVWNGTTSNPIEFITAEIMTTPICPEGWEFDWHLQCPSNPFLKHMRRHLDNCMMEVIHDRCNGDLENPKIIFGLEMELTLHGVFYYRPLSVDKEDVGQIFQLLQLAVALQYWNNGLVKYFGIRAIKIMLICSLYSDTVLVWQAIRVLKRATLNPLAVMNVFTNRLDALKPLPWN